MTAPAAPIINAVQNAGRLVLRWPSVPNAATYNVYVDEVTAPTTKEATVSESGTGQNLYRTNYPTSNLVFARVTAVNAGAEESAYSNEVQRWMTSDSDGVVADASPLISPPPII